MAAANSVVSAGVARAQGATDWQAVRAGATAAATTYAFDFIGRAAKGPNATINPVQRVVLHGATGGLASVANGGKFGPGFLAAAVPTSVRIDTGYVVSNAIVASVVGGTASELGGGKFANGAVTAAFMYAASSFADKLHAQSRQGIASADGSLSRDGVTGNRPPVLLAGSPADGAVYGNAYDCSFVQDCYQDYRMMDPPATINPPRPSGRMPKLGVPLAIDLGTRAYQWSMCQYMNSDACSGAGTPWSPLGKE